MSRIYLLLILFLWQQTGLASSLKESAGEAAPDIIEAVEVIQDFMEDTKLMLSNIKKANKEDASLYKQNFYKLNLKWTRYYFSIENIVLENEDVLNQVVLLDDNIKELEANIDNRFSFFKKKEVFCKDLEALRNYSKKYDDMEKNAIALSMTESLAEKLKELKAEEDILWSDVSEKFLSMKSVMNEFPELGDDAKKEMEQLFADLSVKSQNIKSAEYKPLLERIKGYLYSLAAVAMLLMFINMIQTKISAAKALKKNAKALETLQKQNSQEYPTI